MFRDNWLRIVTIVLLVVLTGIYVVMYKDVPAWLSGLLGFGIGNIFRLQGNGKS